MEITTKNTYQAWIASLQNIFTQGEDFKDQDGRSCREVLNLHIHIEHPEEDSDEPINHMQYKEFIYPTKEELKSIILNKEQQAAYGYSYGPRIFSGVNQVDDFVVPLLKQDPQSRRAMICIYNPSIDAQYTHKHVPGLIMIYFRIKNNQLQTTCVIRSNDFFIGWPGNIYQIHILQKHVAEKLKIATGSISTFSCSAHVFEEHFELITEILNQSK